MDNINDKLLFDKILKRKYKKISVNLDEKTLSKIDEIAKTLEINRTIILEGVLLLYLDTYLEDVIKKLKKPNLEGKRELTKKELENLKGMQKKLENLLDKTF